MNIIGSFIINLSCSCEHWTIGLTFLSPTPQHLL